MNKKTESRTRGMPMALTSRAWNLCNCLYRLRSSLISCNEPELADKLEKFIREFWFYSLFEDAPTLLTIAGPQGVGKSTMVNTLLELSKETQLPVGEESCEHIPIVLMNMSRNDPRTKEADWKPVVVYQKTELRDETQFRKLESLSYDEGRERAIRPKEEDIVMFWYVVENPLLQRLSPIAVLPGLELEAPWVKAIRFILDISDIVIYTLDEARMAQETAAQMEEWIKENRLVVKPITVVTKSAIMSKEKQDDIVKTLSGYGFSPIFTDSNERRGYEELGRAIMESLANVPPHHQSEKLKGILIYEIEPILKKVDTIAKESEEFAERRENRLISEVLKELDEVWEKIVSDWIIDRVKSKVHERAEEARKRARAIAKEEFGGFFKKIKIWYCGGPSEGSIRKVESAIKDAFFSGLDEELSEALMQEISSRITPLPKESASSLKENWVQNALMTILGSSPKKIETTSDELIKSFAEAEGLKDAMVRFLKSSVVDAIQFGEEIRAYSELIKRKGSSAAGLALSGAIGTGGAATAAIEAVGSGVAGLAASVIVGIAGVVVAAVSCLALISSILRSSRKVEWEVEEFTRTLVGEAQRAIIEDFEKRLGRFWDRMRFVLKKDMERRMGLNENIRNAVLLYENLKDARDTLKRIITDLWI
ncbi:MAG: hypothetical protein ABIN66_08625 [candidate division WOR-3 bacterium]